MKQIKKEIKNFSIMRKLVITLIVLFSVFLSSCSGYMENLKKDMIREEAQKKDIFIEINGEKILLAASPQNNGYFSVASLYVDRENTIKFEGASGCKVTIEDTELDVNKENLYELKFMNKNYALTIKVDYADELSNKYFLTTLNDDIADIEYYSKDSDEGVYYFTSNNYLLKVDNTGKYLFFKRCLLPVQDFRKNIIDGKVYYSYLEITNPKGYPHYIAKGYQYATLHILDDNYNQVDLVETMIKSDKVPENWPLEMSDYKVLGDKHYLIMSYVPTYVDNIPEEIPHSKFGARVMASVIQEIKDGNLVWEWKSTDYKEYYAMSNEGNDYLNNSLQWSDYCHLNSIDIDDRDGNIICSFRNLDAIVKINKETGNNIWVLGGNSDEFNLSSEQKFSGQSSVRYIDEGDILIFDNSTNYNPYNSEQEANEQGSGIPRIVRIKLSDNKNLVDYKEFSMNRVGGEVKGSVQFIKDSSYLVSWGESINVPNQAIFTETDYKNNKILFEALVTGDTQPVTYKVYKYNK